MQCYGLWHWFFLVATGLVFVATVYAFAPLRSSVSLMAPFGLAHFLPFTVPLRLLIAWSARILRFFSTCWSLSVTATCNFALLALAVLLLHSVWNRPTTHRLATRVLLRLQLAQHQQQHIYTHQPRPHVHV